MKKGDRVVCIKGMEIDKVEIFFIKGDIYKIIWIEDSICLIRAIKFGLYFSVTRLEGYNLFSDYFITLKEYRKQKLNKIDENRVENSVL